MSRRITKAASAARTMPWDHPIRRAARAAARWETARRDAESAMHLGRADGRLLWLLADGRARTLREVADELSLEQSTVNRQVNAAIKAGLLTRFRSPESTAQLLQPTEHGQGRLQHDLTRQYALHEEALAAVPERQRARFLVNLERFTDAYAAAAQAMHEPTGP